MNVLDNESSSMYFPNGTLLVRLTYTRLHLAIDSTVTVSYRGPLSHHRLIGLCNIALIQKHIYLELYNHEICPIIDDNAMTRERGLTLTLNQLTLGVSPLTFSYKPVVHCTMRTCATLTTIYMRPNYILGDTCYPVCNSLYYVYISLIDPIVALEYQTGRFLLKLNHKYACIGKSINKQIEILE